MLTNEKVKKLIDSIPNDSYRRYVSNRPIMLSSEMSAALGSQKRQTLKIVQTVIEAISNKLFTESITTDDTTLNTALEQWLSPWNNIERTAMRAVVRDGKTYLLTAYNNNAPVVYHIDLYNGRDGAYIFHKNGIPSYGINTWYDGDVRYLDVYYTDTIESYVTDDDGDWRLVKTMDWTDTNNQPLGLALVELSIGESDLANGAVQLQDDINFALIDLLATSRTMGWPQKYLKGSSSLKYVTNQYGAAFTTSAGMPIPRSVTLTPGSIQLIGKDEELGQLDAANPDATVFDKLLHALFIVTTVPMHYFTDGDMPSGVALLQAEQRLNSKVEQHSAALTPAIEQMLRMFIKLNNTFGNTQYNSDIAFDIKFFPPEIETEDLRMEKQKTTAQYVFQLKSAGVISTETAVRILHPDWEDDKVAAELARINAEGAII